MLLTVGWRQFGGRTDHRSAAAAAIVATEATAGVPSHYVARVTLASPMQWWNLALRDWLYTFKRGVELICSIEVPEVHLPRFASHSSRIGQSCVVEGQAIFWSRRDRSQWQRLCHRQCPRFCQEDHDKDDRHLNLLARFVSKKRRAGIQESLTRMDLCTCQNWMHESAGERSRTSVCVCVPLEKGARVAPCSMTHETLKMCLRITQFRLNVFVNALEFWACANTRTCWACLDSLMCLMPSSPSFRSSVNFCVSLETKVFSLFDSSSILLSIRSEKPTSKQGVDLGDEGEKSFSTLTVLIARLHSRTFPSDGVLSKARAAVSFFVVPSDVSFVRLVLYSVWCALSAQLVMCPLLMLSHPAKTWIELCTGHLCSSERVATAFTRTSRPLRTICIHVNESNIILSPCWSFEVECELIIDSVKYHWFVAHDIE